MKKCFFCKRIVMGKRYLGMCPRCFSNFIDIIIILFLLADLPMLSSLVGAFMLIPLIELIKEFNGSSLGLIILGFLVIGISFLICILGIVFLIIRLISRNKKI